MDSKSWKQPQYSNMSIKRWCRGHNRFASFRYKQMWQYSSHINSSVDSLTILPLLFIFAYHRFHHLAELSDIHLEFLLGSGSWLRCHRLSLNNKTGARRRSTRTDFLATSLRRRLAWITIAFTFVWAIFVLEVSEPQASDFVQKNSVPLGALQIQAFVKLFEIFYLHR